MSFKCLYLRIISGKYKGRRLNPPAALPVRPTTDFAREGLFNVLNRMVDFEGLRVLDLFAGTGAVSFEFYSRGASSVMAIDIEKSCTGFISRTASEFGMEGIRTLRSNVLVFLERNPTGYDLVFADPPYAMNWIDELPERVISSRSLAPGGIFILEHDGKYDFSVHPCFLEERKYGRVHFSIFRVGAGA